MPNSRVKQVRQAVRLLAERRQAHQQRQEQRKERLRQEFLQRQERAPLPADPQQDHPPGLPPPSLGSRP